MNELFASRTYDGPAVPDRPRARKANVPPDSCASPNVSTRGTAPSVGSRGSARVALSRLLEVTESETVRFILTGGGAACLFYILTFGFVRAGAPPFAGTATAYGIAFVASYTTQHAWTFKGRQAHARALPRYLAAQIVSATLAATLAHLLATRGAPTAWMALGSTAASSGLSYMLSRYWVFKGRRSATP